MNPNYQICPHLRDVLIRSLFEDGTGAPEIKAYSFNLELLDSSNNFARFLITVKDIKGNALLDLGPLTVQKGDTLVLCDLHNTLNVIVNDERPLMEKLFR